jgi:hypothetical protein
MTTRDFALATALCLWLGPPAFPLPAALGTGGDLPSILSAREALGRSRASIRCLKVTYAEAMDSLSTQDHHKNEYSSAVYVAEAAFTPDLLYYRLQNVSGGRGPFEARPPFVYLTRTEFLKWWPHCRCASRKTPAEGFDAHFFDHEHYFAAVGFWASSLASPGPEDPSLANVLASQPYTVAATNAIVDGAPCWKVLRPGHDEVWLDPALGFAPRRRLWQSRSTDQQGGAAFLYEAQDFREVLPHVWFPWLVQTTRYDSKEGEPSKGTPFLMSQILVRDIHVNDFTSSDLRTPLPPGTLIEDETLQKTLLLPGGEDLLDQVAADVRERFPAPTRGPPLPQDDLRPVSILTAASFFLIVPVLLLFGLRSRLPRLFPVATSSPPVSAMAPYFSTPEQGPERR